MTEEREKRVLLTGASSGIGEQMARLLAQKNYSLIIVARNEDKLKKITEDIGNSNRAKCEYFVCDLSKESEIKRLIKTYPETDLLINNAGFANYGFYYKLPWDREKDMIMVNVVAPCRLCHHYLQGMIARDWGKILNVASIAGLSSAPFMSTYAATKAFLIQFSKSLALELKGKKVTVSCLLPGPTATNFWQVAKCASKIEGVIKRYIDPREVAEFGIRLMEDGKISGIPGWKNKLKNMIKHCMPEKIWSYMIRKHMIHKSLYKDINY